MCVAVSVCKDEDTDTPWTPLQCGAYFARGNTSYVEALLEFKARPCIPPACHSWVNQVLD